GPEEDHLPSAQTLMPAWLPGGAGSLSLSKTLLLTEKPWPGKHASESPLKEQELKRSSETRIHRPVLSNNKKEKQSSANKSCTAKHHHHGRSSVQESEWHRGGSANGPRGHGFHPEVGGAVGSGASADQSPSREGLEKK
ncbi:hypothetical protein U0070_011232, partial [Myodes glareolus]